MTDTYNDTDIYNDADTYNDTDTYSEDGDAAESDIFESNAAESAESASDAAAGSDRDFLRQQITNISELLAMTGADGRPLAATDRELFKEYRDLLRIYMEYSADKNCFDDLPEQPTMKYVMSRIDRLIAANFANWKVNESPEGGRGDAIKAREETNRRLIEFLDKMYDDLKHGRYNRLDRGRAAKPDPDEYNEDRGADEVRNTLIERINCLKHN